MVNVVNGTSADPRIGSWFQKECGERAGDWQATAFPLALFGLRACDGSEIPLIRIMRKGR
jgi:hypothetical protein